MTFEFKVHSWSSTPAEQSHGPFSSAPSLEHLRAISKPGQVKIIDVVPRDDVGILALDDVRQPFKNLGFRTSKRKGGALTSAQIFDACRRTQHLFVFNAGFQIKREDLVGDLKRFGCLELIHRAGQGDVDGVSSNGPCCSQRDQRGFAVLLSLVHNLSFKGNVHAKVCVEKQPIDKRNIT